MYKFSSAVSVSPKAEKHIAMRLRTICIASFIHSFIPKIDKALLRDFYAWLSDLKVSLIKQSIEANIGLHVTKFVIASYYTVGLLLCIAAGKRRQHEL